MSDEYSIYDDPSKPYTGTLPAEFGGNPNPPFQPPVADDSGESGINIGEASDDVINRRAGQEDGQVGDAPPDDGATPPDGGGGGGGGGGEEFGNYRNEALMAANTAAQGAQSRAIGGAEAGGLSPAQAAAMGAQAGTQAYADTFPSALTEMRGQDMSKKLAEIQRDWEMKQAEAAQAGGWAQGAGAMIPGLFELLLQYGLPVLASSDENAKTKIADGHGMLDAVTKHVRGKTFAYKASPGKGEYGVMAQDIEKTPLAGAVVDTPQGKMVDTKRMTMANTGMISELSGKLDKALGYMKGLANGGK